MKQTPSTRTARAGARWAALACLVCLGASHRPGHAREPSRSAVELRAMKIARASQLLERPAAGAVSLQGAVLTLNVGTRRHSPAAEATRTPGAPRWSPTDEALEARWGDGPEGSVALRSAGAVVRVRREGAGHAHERGGHLVQAGARGGALWLADQRAIEELVDIPAGPGEQRYRFELPPGFSLRGAGGGLVEVRDARGVARLRMDAREVWREGGEVVAPAVAVAGSEVVVTTDGGLRGGLLDPLWSSAGTMVFNRVDHRTAMLPDGQLLLVGGDKLGAGYCERFDPESRLFTAAGALNEPRSAPFLHRRSDGKLVVVGGRGLDGSPARTIEVYDPATETFSALGSLDNHGTAFASTLDDRVLLFGNLDGLPDTVVEQLDPFTGERSVLGATLLPRLGVSAAPLPGGKVLLVGGAEDNHAEIFDPATGSSTLSGVTHDPMFAPVMTVMGSGDVLLGSEGVPFERWSIQTGAFRRLPDQVSAGGAMLSLPSGRVLLHDGGLALFEPTINLWAAPQGSFPSSFWLSHLPTGQVLMTGDSGGALGEAWLIREDVSVDRQSDPTTVQEAHGAVRLDSGEVLLLSGAGGPSQVLRSDLKRFDSVDEPRGSDGALIKLASGRVLRSGGQDNGGNPIYEGAIFDPELRRWMPGPELGPLLHHTPLVLPDGRVMILGGFEPADGARVTLWDEKTGAVSSNSWLKVPRTRGTATLLPDGRVLILGGNTNFTKPEILDPATGVSQTFGKPMGERIGPTATSLKDGNVLLVGGASLGVPLVVATPQAMLYDLSLGELVDLGFPGHRAGHTATLLPDGRVLLAGGFVATSGSLDDYAPTQLYDPVTRSLVETGQPVLPRYDHQATLLSDGRVLLSGGFEMASGGKPVTRLEVYDPATGTFSLVTGTTLARSGAAHAVLPSGDVLLAGGGAPTEPSGQVLRLSPGQEQFEPLPVTLTPPRTDARAALLGDGSVLLAGGVGPGGPLADLWRYQPGGALLPLGAMTQGRSRPVALRVASGGVLLGGDGPSLDLLSPGASAVSPAATVTARSSVAAAQLTDGSVVLAGGVLPGGSVALAVERLDARSLTAKTEASIPLGEGARALALPGGGALLAGQGYLGAYAPGGSLSFVGGCGTPTGGQALFSGDILVTCAGQPDQARLIGPTGALQGELLAFPASEAPEQNILRALPDGEIFHGHATGGPGSPMAHAVRELLPRGVARPSLLQAPKELTPGEIVTVKGARLRRVAAVGANYLDESADRHPAVAFWVEGGGPRFGRVTQASDQEITFEVPRTASPGPGWLVAVVDGVPSEGVPTRMAASGPGQPCAVDPECGSGYCVGGVCCESACTGSCLTCLAAEQGPQGQDGLCLPIAAGLDPRGDCDLDNTECGRTGACDGAGQCQLAPQGKPCSSGGTCSEGSCLAPLPPRCDPSRSVVEVGNVALPCAPFSCAGSACLDSCSNDQDCAEGYRCSDGACGPYCSESGDKLLSPLGDVDCAPFRCVSGRCASSCTTNLQCAPGLLCGRDGRCRSFPAAQAAPGCSHSGSNLTPTLWVLLASLGLLGARRRRAARLARLTARLAAALAALAGAPRRGEAADPAAPAASGAAPAASGAAPAASGAAPAASGAAPAASGAAPAASGAEAAALAAAKEEFRRGVILFEAGDFEVALDHFRRSRALYPSRKNTMNIAVSLERLGRFDEALEVFEEALGRFGGELTAEERERVPTTVAMLRSRVGELDISASTHGELIVDGRRRGQLPLVAPLRLLPGQRRLRVVRDGYEPFQAEVEVRSGERSRLEVSLAPLTVTGRLRVEQESLVGAQLFVDGTRVGELPWEGALAPGPHIVQAIQQDTGSAPTPVTVLQGQTALLRLRVGPLSPLLRVQVTPVSAALRLGEVPLGQGSWEGRLPEGTYSLTAHEEGYLAATYALVLPGQPSDRISLSLAIDHAHPRWPRRSTARFWAAAELGGAIGPSLRSGAESSCGAYCARSVPVGPLGLLSAGVDLPQGLSLSLLGGYLGASAAVKRHLRRSYSERLEVDYTLDQDPSIRSALLAFDAGYRAALGGWTLRGGLGIGVLFVQSHDDARGSAASGPSQAPLLIEKGDARVSSTPVVALTSLSLERPLGSFTLVGSLRAVFSPSTGPSYPQGSAFVTPDCSSSSPGAVGCAPEADLLTGRRAYGPFALLLPTLGLRYLFGGSSP